MSSSACSSSSGRRVRHSSSMRSHSSTNPIIPPRRSFGKYVPAKKGRPSGVHTTVIGQPPCPVMAWVASM